MAYEYAFWLAPDARVSGSLGVHYMQLSQQLSGMATFTDANGVTSAAAFTRKENSVPLPLPVIGFRAAWAFAPQWVLEGQGQIFKADIDGYDGRVTDVARRRDVDVQPELRRRRRLQPVRHDGRDQQGTIRRTGAAGLFGRPAVHDRGVERHRQRAGHHLLALCQGAGSRARQRATSGRLRGVDMLQGQCGIVATARSARPAGRRSLAGRFAARRLPSTAPPLRVAASFTSGQWTRREGRSTVRHWPRP